MSMRILDLQRRLREVGRIRIGEQVPTSSGRSRPAKLEVFRLTSRDRAVIKAAAAHFGGTAETWDADGGQQWQVKTTSAEMAVVVPPGDMAFSQAYEQWSAGGCRVRCDGRWDHQNDKACHCNPEARDCAIHTRLSVMLPDLPGLGVWRLDTSGYYAAVELGGVVDLAAGFAERGQMLPARLRLEQRTVKRIKPDGEAETRRFAVPVLDLDVHPMALTGGTMVAAEIGSGAPRFEPVPAELATPPTASVADQVKGLGAGDKPKRRNAAASIPSTGAKPRTAAEVAEAGEVGPPVIPARAKAADPPADVADSDRCDAIQAAIDMLTQPQRQALGAWWKAQKYPALRSGALTIDQADDVDHWIASAPVIADENGDAPNGPGDPGATDGRNKKMWAMVAEAWPNEPDDDRDQLRRHVISVVTEGRSESSKDMAPPEWDGLFQALDDIKAGTHELHLRASGDWTIRMAPKKAS